MQSKRTKATSISRLVKLTVWERDEHRCIMCQSPYANPNAHYLSRANGGLGIEENIVTLCLNCHRKVDQSVERKLWLAYIKSYLQSKYKEWNEEKLKYGNRTNK